MRKGKNSSITFHTSLEDDLRHREQFDAIMKELKPVYFSSGKEDFVDGGDLDLLQDAARGVEDPVDTALCPVRRTSVPVLVFVRESDRRQEIQLSYVRLVESLVVVGAAFSAFCRGDRGACEGWRRGGELESGDGDSDDGDPAFHLGSRGDDGAWRGGVADLAEGVDFSDSLRGGDGAFVGLLFSGATAQASLRRWRRSIN